MRKNRDGVVLLWLVILLGLLLVSAALLTRMVYNNQVTVTGVWGRTQAFYLAEAGIEKGKQALAKNPNWYTDLPAPSVDNERWLLQLAVGEKSDFGGGHLKIVLEQDRNRLYAVGLKGKSQAILKIIFSLAPWQVLEWQEL